MVQSHCLGFPRIGAHRELKFALERYWRAEDNEQQLLTTAAQLRQQHWQHQSTLNWLTVGDFSFYDQVLDTSLRLSVIPERMANFSGTGLDTYFRMARGRAPGDPGHQKLAASEMTKWFDTNYHYLVPEFSQNTRFQLNDQDLQSQIAEARALHHSGDTNTTIPNLKPVLIGPITYLSLGKSHDDSDKLKLLPSLINVYQQWLTQLAAQGITWVQMDEPALVTDLDPRWQQAYRDAYQVLAQTPVQILLTTYFGALEDNLPLVCKLPVAGLHFDLTQTTQNIDRVLEQLPHHTTLSLGVINGRNIWRADLTQQLDFLEPIAERLENRLWLGSSCSLLHVPVDLQLETQLDSELRSWLAFAKEKINEIQVLTQALNQGRASVARELAENAAAITSRRTSGRIHRPQVQAALAQVTDDMAQRRSAYATRAPIQQEHLDLPLLPTTTIGSFPQTLEIRQARQAYRQGQLQKSDYDAFLKTQIAHCIQEQEMLGLDVLVHGEAERNDMVEYFGEQLEGFAFTRYGWVQSYGSRCVKPPILFGDVVREQPMTVAWIAHAQSLTSKVVKGMLTGPVTILNWSFVRDDQPRTESCLQLALAIRQEVLDLEQAGIAIIQIDEAALREGLPLRRKHWQHYLDWAVRCFRITANGVHDRTQIHTHMCYSEFNDILPAIAQMDADVITIETSRSGGELLKAFKAFQYPQAIGPGVYDIHSPNTPTVEHINSLMQQAAEHIPVARLWINPDCGLKTRTWAEVRPALEHLVQAATQLRKHFQKENHTASQINSEPCL